MPVLTHESPQQPYALDAVVVWPYLLEWIAFIFSESQATKG